VHLGDSSASLQQNYGTEYVGPRQIQCGADLVSVNHRVFAFNRELMAQPGRARAYVHVLYKLLHLCMVCMSASDYPQLLHSIFCFESSRTKPNSAFTVCKDLFI